MISFHCSEYSILPYLSGPKHHQMFLDTFKWCLYPIKVSFMFVADTTDDHARLASSAVLITRRVCHFRSLNYTDKASGHFGLSPNRWQGGHRRKDLVELSTPIRVDSWYDVSLTRNSIMSSNSNFWCLNPVVLGPR